MKMTKSPHAQQFDKQQKRVDKQIAKMAHIPKRGPICPDCGSGDTTMQYHPAGDEAYCDGCGLVWHVTKK